MTRSLHEKYNVKDPVAFFDKSRKRVPFKTKVKGTFNTYHTTHLISDPESINVGVLVVQ